MSRHALLYTEMVTALAIRHGDRQRLLGFDSLEQPVALQIGGSDPKLLAEAAKWANVIMLTMPDTEQKATYEEFIKPHMRKGKALAFAHGFNIRFKRIRPPKTVDVIMIAPKGPGHLVRRTYTEGGGVPALIAAMGTHYPELVRAQALITETLKLEESRFKKTLGTGLKLLDDETRGLGAGGTTTAQAVATNRLVIYKTFELVDGRAIPRYSSRKPEIGRAHV